MKTRKIVVLHLGAIAAASLLFAALPGLDLSASGFFYRPGAGFYLAGSFPVQSLFHLIPWLVTAQVILIPFLVAVGWWRRHPVLGIDLRAGLFVLIALALGPGLIVNGIFKDHWGRARPVQVSEFGGTRQFTPAPLLADQCDRNCSFVAGHPAVGFALIAYAYLARERRRRRLIAAGAIGFGSLVGLVRIVQGGHFLSDVVFSGLLVSLLTAVLASLLIERDGLGWARRYLRAASNSTGIRWVGFTAFATLLALAAIRYADLPVARYLHQGNHEEIAIFTAITNFGLAGGYLLVTALAALALWAGARWARSPERAARLRTLTALPIFLFLSIALSGVITDTLKIVFGRARPKLLFFDNIYGFTWWNLEPRYWSFPSGHSSTAFAIGTAISMLWPRLLPVGLFFASLICVSRAIVGEHFVSDAIAGAFVGIAATWCVRALFRRLRIDLAAIAQRRSVQKAAPETTAVPDLVKNP